MNFKLENTRRLISIHDAFAGYALTNDQAELVNRLERFIDEKRKAFSFSKAMLAQGKPSSPRG